MKKYYIFAINPEYYEIYRRNKHVLYNTLKNLHDLDLNSLNYGISIYNQICIPINVNSLTNYYKDYKYMNNLFFIDNSLIEINNSCIIILTKNMHPVTLNSLHYYKYPLFVCNFNDNEYYFLSYEYLKKTSNIIK